MNCNKRLLISGRCDDEKRQQASNHWQIGTMRRPPIYSDVVVVQAQDVTGQDVTGHDPGVIVRVGGCYSFRNWYGSNGKLRQFSGRIVEISSHEMVLTAPVVGKTGICATVKCDEFGQWRGIVCRPASHGFAIEIAANAAELGETRGQNTLA